MLKNQVSLLMLLLLSVVSGNVHAEDNFSAFEGKWKHTSLFCRAFNGPQMVKEYATKLIKSGDDTFYPDVELKFSASNMNLNGQIVPAKNLEKAVTQGSCKLEKPAISVMNQSGNSNYIWSSNRIQLQPKANIGGIQFYEMSGYLLEKKINYSNIRDCGRQDNQVLSVPGVISALFTYYRYSVGKSYFQVEADRKYNVYIKEDVLNLEFFEKDICADPNERVVMQFKKVSM